MTCYEVLRRDGLEAISIQEAPSGNLGLRVVDIRGSAGGLRAFSDGQVRGAALVYLIERVQELERDLAELRGTGKRQKAGVR